MGSFVLQSSCFLEILASGNKSFSFGGKTELYHSFYLEAEGWDETLRKLSAAAKSLQSWPTLCNPIDSSPPGSPVPGVLQARTLDWVAISFSNTWKWKVKVKSLSRVQLLVTPWTAAYQAFLSRGFSRQEYWSGVLLRKLSDCVLNLWLVLHVHGCPSLSPSISAQCLCDCGWWSVWPLKLATSLRSCSL